MIQFLSNSIRQYTYPGDTSDLKTIFQISALNSGEMQVVNDATMTFNSTDGTVVKLSLRYRLMVKLGLHGWENGPASFASERKSVLGLPEKEVITDEMLNKIPVTVVNAIGEEIQRISGLSGDAEKN